MIMDFVMPAPGCGQPETRPAILYKVHFTYFSLILFVIGSFTIVAVSYMTKPGKDFEVMKRHVMFFIFHCYTKRW